MKRRLLIDLDWNMGDCVALRADPDAAGMVTGIIVRPGGMLFEVTWSAHSVSDHYAFELRETEEPKPDPLTTA